MRIERARAEHMDAILAIERASFTDPWSREGLEDYLDAPGGELLVCLEGPEVLGFAVFHVSYEDAELYNIAVDPVARGMGAGKALLGEVLRRAGKMGAERMFLEVRRSNAAARALYASAGFSVCGVRRGYYQSPPEDAVLMDKLLEK